MWCKIRKKICYMQHNFDIIIRGCFHEYKRFYFVTVRLNMSKNGVFELKMILKMY